MITETGKIISIKKAEDQKVIYVECISKSACSSCQSQKNCGVGMVSKAFSDKSQYFAFPYKEGMKEGQFIELQISNESLIKSAVLMYLVPLCFFVGSSLVIKKLFNVNEGILILISVFFTALGFMFARLITKKFSPKITNNMLISAKTKK